MSLGGWAGGWFGGGGSGAGGSFIAGDIVDAARLRHPSFDTAVIPQSVALALVTDAERELRHLVEEADASVLVTTTTISMLGLSQDDFTTGLGVPAYQAIVRAYVVGTDAQATESPVLQCEIANRFAFAAGQYAIYEENGSIYLAKRDDLWKNVASLVIKTMTAAPAVYTSRSTAISLPNGCYDALVAGTAYRFGERGNALGVVADKALSLLAENRERTATDLRNELLHTGMPRITYTYEAW